MKLEPTLTKKNFWNEMMEKYPKSTKSFFDWIDEYKKEVDWVNLFNEHLNVKFHDIPYAMQQGIWICFVNNTLHKFFEQPEYNYQFDLAEDIKEVFGEIEPLIEEDED
jgi:hypothetical protein